MRKRLVVIGNGMAGVRCVEEIQKIDREQFDITIIGQEPHPNYNRIQLSAVLAGDSNLDDIVLNPYEWYRKSGIQLYTGQTVNRIDPQKKQVSTDQKLILNYDRLIFATGSLPFILPLPGAKKEGVIAFRDIQDCKMMMETAKVYRKAIVIGGGLLGLEAARGLLNLKMGVTVVHIHDHLMERQLDPIAAKMLQAKLEQQGMRFLLKKQSAEIIGRKRVQGLKFADGTMEPADLIVMAVGIRPNVQLAIDAGLAVSRGIVVNDQLQTSLPEIYAVGECAEHRGKVYGLVAPLYEQGKVLAQAICGDSSAAYQGSIISSKLKVSGVEVFSAGEFSDTGDTRAIRAQDEWSGIYKKLVVREDKIVGTVLFGDTSDSSRILQMMRSGASIQDFKRVSVLEQLTESDAAGVDSSIAGMADDEMVCGCNGVSKGTIVKAILEQGLKTVSEIKACTNASRSCGGCKPLVQELLNHVVGDETVGKEVKEAICACTSMTRDEVVSEIRQKHLTSVKEVMHVLGWNHTEGCSKCRPALNYYLTMVWPQEHDDEKQSRFVNERLHANIQNDGSYSVVPRMYGGVTTPDDLRRIADVADKYKVRMVKVTGGQRIDLLGAQKDDLEKKFEHLNTPAKVKMAVSGCPRNCAESGIKDLGVVGIEGGWEIYVGGNGGVKVRQGDLLCKVKTDEEVMQVTSAYLQFYRETAKYGERTSEWVERIGLQTIRDAIGQESSKEGLLERMETALTNLTDPWQATYQNPSLRSMFEELPVLTSKD